MWCDTYYKARVKETVIVKAPGRRRAKVVVKRREEEVPRGILDRRVRSPCVRVHVELGRVKGIGRRHYGTPVSARNLGGWCARGGVIESEQTQSKLLQVCETTTLLVEACVR